MSSLKEHPVIIWIITIIVNDNINTSLSLSIAAFPVRHLEYAHRRPGQVLQRVQTGAPVTRPQRRGTARGGIGDRGPDTEAARVWDGPTRVRFVGLVALRAILRGDVFALIAERRWRETDWRIGLRGCGTSSCYGGHGPEILCNWGGEGVWWWSACCVSSVKTGGCWCHCWYWSLGREREERGPVEVVYMKL